MRQIDALEALIARIDLRIEADLDPFRDAVRLLTTTPGMSDLAAQTIVSEIGVDMGRNPSEAHLTLGLACARATTKAQVRSDPPACERARTGSRRRSSSLLGPSGRSRAISRPNSTACALGVAPRTLLAPSSRRSLRAAYHMLRNHVPYADLGADHFDKRRKIATAGRLVRRFKDLGFAAN